MTTVPRNILVTGPPGIGKTTFLRKLWQQLQPCVAAGFYTEEIREKGIRRGFALLGLDGYRSVLAHDSLRSKHKVGKYRVDVEGFEEFLDTIDLKHRDIEIVLIDEIGKMECMSEKFVTLLTSVLNSEKLLVATIAHKGTGPIAAVKERDDVLIFTLNRDNRIKLLPELVKLLLSQST